jgi:hypothetical protein
MFSVCVTDVDIVKKGFLKRLLKKSIIRTDPESLFPVSKNPVALNAR